nr:hypothetical protein [Tanacetum cinerariifolium]
THNVVAILEKSDAAEGFKQLIDFLSGSYIHYALTVSPHIYISCIKQFWNSVSVKCSGDVTSSKFYMYPHFIQLIIQNQVGDLSTHTTRFISLALTQKVFTNMRRVGKGFSGVETPLFEEDVAEDVAHMATPSPPPHGISSPPQEPSLPPHQPPCPPQPQDAEVPSILFQQVLDTCSALARRVKGLEKDKASQQLEIIKIKARVKKLEKINMVKSSKLRRLKKDEGIELVADQEKDAKVEGRHAEKQAELYNLDQDHSSKVLSMQEDDTDVDAAVADAVVEEVVEDVTEDVAHVATPSPPPHGIPSPHQEPSLPPQQPHVTHPAPTQGEAFPATFQQVLDTCSALLRHIKHLEHDNVAQRLEIVKLKARVKKLEQTDKVKSSKLRRLRKVGASRQVRSSDDMEDVFNQGRMMNEDEGSELVKDAEIAESEGRQADKQAEIYNIDLDHSSKVLSSAASATIPAVSVTIPAAAPTVVAAYIKRRKGVTIRGPEEELPLKTPAETPKVKDKGKG